MPLPDVGLGRLTAILNRGRAVAFPLALVACIGLLVRAMHGAYPIDTWLLWHYLGYWLCAAAFSVACLSSGHFLLRRVFRVWLPLGEHLAVAFALGVLAFATSIFLVGIVRLLRWPAFFAVPLLLFALGAKDSYRACRRLLRHLRAARARGGPVPFSALALTTAAGFGVLLMYVPAMSPGNVGYDSQWYHLPIAEHYVAQGGILPFREGWLPGTGPHLGSLLYTWAFLLPKVRLLDHVLLSAHIEMLTVLGMLAAIGPLVRRLTRSRSPRGIWGIVWLFPTIFLCDINCGADHISALFTAPAYLMLLRAWPRLDRRFSALMSVLAGGVILTKYSALPVFAIVVGAYVVRVAWLLAKRLRARSPEVDKWGPAVALGAGLAITAQWWLKNWITYANPVFPSLQAVFPASRPWSPHLGPIREAWTQANMWAPPRSWEGVKETLFQVYHFSFQTHDWDSYAGKTPVFGFLFTLASLALPFVRTNLRTWGLFLAGNGAVFGWYSIHHQERYLQTPLPWFAAAAAAFLVHAWRAGRIARVLTLVLVGCQLAWGTGLYLLPSHHRFIQPLLDLATSGFRKQVEARYNVFGGHAEVGKHTPPDSVIVIHESHVHLGLGRASISDWVGWQTGIDYGVLGSPGGVWDKLHRMKATHLSWESASKGSDSFAGDLLFYGLALLHTKDARSTHGYTVAALPPTRPPEPASDVVAFLGCGDLYASGLYHVRDLSVPVVPNAVYPKPFAPPPEPGAIAEVAQYVVVKAPCGAFAPPANRFRALPARAGYQTWIRLP